MKNIILILIVSSFFLTIKAQDRKVRVGLAFSNAISFMKSDNVDIKPTKAGYAFDYGLVLDINFSENYSLGTGFIISQLRSARSNTPGITNDTSLLSFGVVPGAKEIYNFTYLDIPTTFKLKTNELGYFRYFGEFGFVNSFRVRARVNVNGSEFENESLTNRGKSALNVKSNFYNASLKVGGGFEYTISDKTALLVGLYFYNGFVNVLNDGDDERTVLRRVSLRTGIMF